ncbi:glycoside hydrolase superfamily [Pyronema omphalodes]|nr:glycoside hydrolase superfamily [Pyronema omphalodes]
MAKLSALLAACLLLQTTSATLWPIPTQEFTQGNKTLWMSENVSLEFGRASDKPESCGSSTDGYGGNELNRFTNAATGSQKIRNAWERTQTALFKNNIVPWKFHPKGSNYEPEWNSGTKIKRVVVTQTGEDVDMPTYSQMKEAYNLTIPDGCDTVYITAESSLGVLHAFHTLEQLFYATARRSRNVWGKGPVKISDSPKFKHRGLNLDVSRQWYPKEAILRTIDALSFNKMNRLHLHATDSQSWPLEIPSMPELAKKGSYAPGLTYSPQDLQEILDFAEARGIQVIVEIDMPGHTTSIAEAYPDLIVGKNKQPNWDTYAAQPPSGSLKLNNKAVEDFTSKLFDDLLPRLNKHTKYYHTGGDEVNKNVYALDPGVGSNEVAKIRPGLQKFIDHVHGGVKKHKMTPFVWEEMLLDWGLNLAKETIVQTWQTDAAAMNATRMGHQIIGGNYNYWYLDCGHGQWLDFGGPNGAQKFYPYNDYCSPRKNWRLIYSYSPDQFLTKEEAKLVLGGEVHIWSEQIDAESLDVTLWPRGSAAAEVLWSGRQDASGKNRTFADASPRLGEFRERLVARGVKAQPVMQLWCHQNLGDCQLDA